MICLLQVFSCHAGRVKRLATTPGQPFTFWSGGEDGLVMEFDLRAPELAQPTNPKNVLINLNHHLGLNAEVKCLAVNPLRPHLLAVGANDPFVRVFDRRMLTCSSVKFPNGSSTNQGGGGGGASSSSSSSRFTNAPWDQRHALLTHLLSEEGERYVDKLECCQLRHPFCEKVSDKLICFVVDLVSLL